MRRLFVLLLGVLMMGGSALAATLSGSWDTDVVIDPQEANFSDAIAITSEATVSYIVGNWTFSSITDLYEGGWQDQDFVVSGILGAFTLTSALGFEPTVPAFDSWNTTAAVSIAGVSFDADFTLADSDVTLILGGSGVAGDIDVGIEISFGGDDNDVCDLNWSELEISVGFPFCCTTLETIALFDCDGFQSIVLLTEGIAIPNLPFLTLDASIEFTLQTKTLTLSPVIEFGVTACVDLYVDLGTSGGIGPGSPLVLESITIDGVGVSCDVGVVTFTGLSYWGAGSKPGLLAGTDYWEVYHVSSNDEACCGPFTFDLAVYFLDAGAMLFDVSLIDADVTLQIATQFAFNMGMEIDVELGAFTEWVIGFLVSW